MRRITLILTLLMLTPLLPLAAANAAVPVGATGPDAEGAWALVFDVARDAAGRAAASLDVVATDATTTHATRDLGAMDLAAGATRLNLSFLPAEGPGDYAVALVLDGVASEPARFHVEGSAGASASFSFAVPDEPTYLNLTSDTVNADGKQKLPGDDVITRVTIHDANGLGDLDPALRYVVDGPSYHAEGALALPATPNATDAALEHRFHDSPMPNATFRLTLSATRGGVALANATRTFVIKETATSLVPFALANATPDAELAIPVDVLLADKNGAPAAGTLEARVYRGSAISGNVTAVFVNGNATTDTASGVARSPVDGAGITAYPLTIRVPQAANPGQLRVSILLNGATLGSATLNLSALPTLASMNVTQQGDALAFDAVGSGDGVLRVTLREGEQTTRVDAAFVNGTAHVVVALAPEARALRWNASLLARPDGPVLAAREGDWSRAAPNVTLTLARGLPRLPASWSVAAPGYDLGGASANVTILRWDGSVEPNLTARFDGANLVVDGPASLAPGRYTLVTRITFANGTIGAANTTFDAGPWVRVALAAPTVAGREARLVVTNEGGLAVRRVVVETDAANVTVSLLANGTTLAPRAGANGRLVFDGLSLAPGDQAVLVARLPDGPLPSGTRAMSVRVLASPGGA